MKGEEGSVAQHRAGQSLVDHRDRSSYKSEVSGCVLTCQQWSRLYDP
jgi:hypothetical protein